MQHRTIMATVAGVVLATVVAAGSPAGAGGSGERYAPKIRARDFGGPIDNPYLPLIPGSRWVYENDTPDGLERIDVGVTKETKRVLGIETVVVHDTVTLDGVIIEDTFDWFAQDKKGNVWYFGEDTHEYENGVPVNSSGAWQAGVDGAKPGIIMKAHPRVGDQYRQEYYKGEAEDMGKVLSLDASATVPFGSFKNMLKTKDFTPLEPGVAEHKFYAKGVGVVLEVSAKGGNERVELIEHAKG